MTSLKISSLKIKDISSENKINASLTQRLFNWLSQIIIDYC